MDISRRGFLKLLGVSPVAVKAGGKRKPEIADEAVQELYVSDHCYPTASCHQMSEEEIKLIRYWELKDYLGSAEYDNRIGFHGQEDKELWQEYYSLCDYFGSIGGEPRVRMVNGQLMVLDTSRIGENWRNPKCMR